MARLRILDMSNRQAGTYSFADVSVPQGMKYIAFYVDVTNIVGTTKTAILSLYMSLDGNEPYDIVLFEGIAFKGNRPANGIAPFFCSFGILLPSPELTTRKIKGQLVLSATMRIAAEIEVTTA